MGKRIVVLGSTGSVGRNVIDVVAHHPDEFEVVGLAARSNTSLLGEQCVLHPGARFVVQDESAQRALLDRHPDLGSRSVSGGAEPFVRLIEETSPDLLVNCLVGFVGLRPTLAALESGVPVALANKEAIVTGGELVMRASKRAGAEVIPIDSEHVAISQCLRGSSGDDIKRVYLTASGGALRNRPMEDLADVRVEDVLAHPTWNMGDKITVDSATLLNKGLEVIEAHWLFDLPFEKIDIVIHPQSVIHCLVEFKDNSILSQMGQPDMRLPILYALTYPGRIKTDLAMSVVADFPDLTLARVEEGRYPCFGLALRAAEMGGNAPAILNSSNELAVGAFLARKLPFGDIPRIIELALERVAHGTIDSFEDVLETDRTTRAFVNETFNI
jgi:1-deoxy-D-xylulose-5-phosphate reductoisomerase